MNPSEKPYAALVIGSGFGGTIMALTLANFFESRNKGRSRANLEEVCVLERGQWWISHEILARPADKRQGEPPDKRNMREYLDDAGQQYAFWAHPDNVEGIVRLASMARQASKRGLYDYRVLSPNVHALTASGVGGGSLVYANVTLKPPAEVYEKWPTEGRGDGLDNYFPRAEEFIGVNKITTVAGLSGQKLARSKAFQDAARAARERLATQKRADGLEIAEPMDGYDLNLSITDLPANLFDGFPLNPGSLTPQQLESYQEVVTKYQSKIQTNVCQRQGRCNLGCVPGARHTLNKRFYLALLKNKPLVVKALHEAVTITYIPGSEFPYRVDCWDYSGGEDSPVLKSIWTKRLVVSAGTLGTVELLKKSVARKGLSLSDRLGQHFSTDGDLLGFMTVLDDKHQVDNTRGPINTSHVMFNEGGKFAFSIEDTGISNMVADLFATSFEFQAAKKANVPFTQRLKLFLRFPGMAPLTLLLGLTPSRLIGVLSKVWTNDLVRSFRLGMVQPESLKAQGTNPDPKTQRFLRDLFDLLFTDADQPLASPAERLKKFFVFSCMGRDNADGTLDLSPGWEKIEEKSTVVGERLRLDYSLEKNKAIFDKIIEGMRALAEAVEPGGGQRVVTPTWDETKPPHWLGLYPSWSPFFLSQVPEEEPDDPRKLVVLHPLGGCKMAESRDRGVVDSYGRVFTNDGSSDADLYPDFYVVDGSIVPDSLGVNSSLTISAIAFRSAEKMVGSQDFWPRS
ncbi:MAG TPA: GMC oxidoreductase [Thermoplasmata archaeon]|nr:GMC oxidoreductase [Thermoplasmata archaeon]